MIKNERQYQVTKGRAETFAAELVRVRNSPTRRAGVDARLRRAEVEAMQSQLDGLQAELAEYEALRSGQQTDITITSLEDLAKMLIEGRIAAGMTQHDLADRLGIAEQQVQRYEASDYLTASLAKVLEVARAIGLHVYPTVAHVTR